MQNHGDRYSLLLLLLCLLFCSSHAIGQSYYYVCAYDSNNELENNILVSKVDLENRSITAQTTIPIHGNIAFRAPIKIQLRNRLLLASVTNDGIIGKNSAALDSLVSNYAVLDSNLQILRIGHLFNMHFLMESDYPISPFQHLKYIRGTGENSVEYTGRPVFSRDLDINILDSIPYIYRDIDYPIINRFQHFKKVSFDNNIIYWNVIEQGLYLIKLDVSNRQLLDSTRLAENLEHGYLFGLLGDSLIYSFVINYNSISGGPGIEKLTIDPSYLIKYDARNFEKVDSIPLPYPSLDYGYVQPEIGSCEKVGPFFVYYFFLQENFTHFSPAMLFIFDTRTNETTWLRVGWR
jgi:hypothetical protein